MSLIDTKTPKSASTLERILESARVCFDAEGFQNTKMTGVARHAGISRAALYKYFPTKQSLLVALHDWLINDAVDNARKILGAEGSALEIIERWLRDNLHKQETLSTVRILTLPEVQIYFKYEHDEHLSVNALKQVRDELLKVIRRGMREGEIRADLNARHTSHMLQVLAFSINRNSMADRPIIDLGDKRHEAAFIELVLRGLAN